MALTFYYAPMTSAVRVHWALEELGLPYEKVKVDLQAGAQNKPEYLKINPNGKVPALVDDGVPMFESLAILIHLGEKYGVAKKVWPAPGTPDHMHALSWTVWGSVTAASHLFRVMYNTMDRFPAGERNLAQAESAKKDFGHCLEILDHALTGKEYLVGNAFSLVDVANASTVAFAGMRMGIDFSAHKNVAAWVARSTQRPAMARAAAG